MGKRKVGDSEETVIRALLNLNNEAIGGEIGREIGRVTGNRLTPGHLYSTIDALVAKRFIVVKSTIKPSFENGNREQRLLEVTPEGKEAVREKEAARKGFSLSYEMFRSGRMRCI